MPRAVSPVVSPAVSNSPAFTAGKFRAPTNWPASHGSTIWTNLPLLALGCTPPNSLVRDLAGPQRRRCERQSQREWSMRELMRQLSHILVMVSVHGMPGESVGDPPPPARRVATTSAGIPTTWWMPVLKLAVTCGAGPSQCAAGIVRWWPVTDARALHPHPRCTRERLHGGLAARPGEPEPNHITRCPRVAAQRRPSWRGCVQQSPARRGRRCVTGGLAELRWIAR